MISDNNEPCNNYDFDRDDLENVHGFDDEWDENVVYEFKLNEHGTCTWKLIDVNGFDLDDNN